MGVPNACVFMADPALEGMSVEDKSAFLASKGVDSFVIAQSTCVTNEDNVQGHPELPVVEKAAAVDEAVGVPAACKFMADPTLKGMSVEDKSAFLASKGVDAFVIAQATCVTNEDNVQGHPELPGAAAPVVLELDDDTSGPDDISNANILRIVLSETTDEETNAL